MRSTKILKTDNTVSKNVEQLEPSCTAGGGVIGTTTLENNQA